jgi:hypothetical protein
MFPVSGTNRDKISPSIGIIPIPPTCRFDTVFVSKQIHNSMRNLFISIRFGFGFIGVERPRLVSLRCPSAEYISDPNAPLSGD